MSIERSVKFGEVAYKNVARPTPLVNCIFWNILTLVAKHRKVRMILRQGRTTPAGNRSDCHNSTVQMLMYA